TTPTCPARSPTPCSDRDSGRSLPGWQAATARSSSSAATTPTASAPPGSPWRSASGASAAICRVASRAGARRGDRSTGSSAWRSAASGPGSAPATRSSSSRVPSLVTFAAYSRQNRPTNVPDERASRLALGRPHRLALQLPVRQLLAQDLLVELADARLRHLVDERDLVRQPPARHARRQV